MFNKIKSRFNNKKGFTLVELIVVIVIILILAAVLVPNVTKYVGNARKASVQSDASAVLTQVQADYIAYLAGGSASGVDTDIKDDSNKKPTYDTTKVNNVTVTLTDSTYTDPSTNQNAIAKYDGKAIVEFVYRDKDIILKWTQASGSWTTSNAS